MSEGLQYSSIFSYSVLVFSSLIVSLTILTLRHSKSAASHAHAHTVWVHTRYLGPLLSCLLFYGTFGAPRSRSA